MPAGYVGRYLPAGSVCRYFTAGSVGRYLTAGSVGRYLRAGSVGRYLTAGSVGRYLAANYHNGYSPMPFFLLISGIVGITRPLDRSRWPLTVTKRPLLAVRGQEALGPLHGITLQISGTRPH